MDRQAMNRHRLANMLQSAALVLGITLLFGLCGWILAGPSGVIAMAATALLALVLAPHLSARQVCRSLGARPIGTDEAPDLYKLLSQLSRRAEIGIVPRLFVVPWGEMTAFTIGRSDAPYIIVSAGLLRGMEGREIVGVLAHEVAHIRNNDIWILGLADSVTRLTRLAATLGFFLVVLNIPLLTTGRGSVSWFLILVMLAAPTLSALLQLGLARTREFRADLEAVGLTGDAEGLARALHRLESGSRAILERLLGYGWRDPVPSMLRSHPRTEERIERLLALRGERPRSRLDVPARLTFPSRLAVGRAPRRWPWYPGPRD